MKNVCTEFNKLKRCISSSTDLVKLYSSDSQSFKDSWSSFANGFRSFIFFEDFLKLCSR